MFASSALTVPITNSDRDLEQAVEQAEAQNVSGYVLDLRDNSGGLLYSSIDIARMWLDEGTIVDRKGIRESESAKNKALTDKPLTDKPLTDKPLVVLVDKGTASASEIVTAALKENQRATIIGERTYGSGSIQSVRPLRDGSGLAVTIAKFVTEINGIQAPSF